MNNSSVSLEFFKEYYLPNSYNQNIFKKDVSINPQYNSFKNTGIIASIFEDH